MWGSKRGLLETFLRAVSSLLEQGGKSLSRLTAHSLCAADGIWHVLVDLFCLLWPFPHSEERAKPILLLFLLPIALPASFVVKEVPQWTIPCS